MQVSAQVMTRDDSTGGWVPIKGGGLSKVKLCKLAPLGDDGQQLSSDSYRPEYVIYGERIDDNTVSCSSILPAIISYLVVRYKIKCCC